MGMTYRTHGKDEKFIKNMVRKPEEERPLGRPNGMWEDNIKMLLSEEGWEGVDWMHLAQDRDQWRTVVNMVMKFQVA